MKTTITFIFLLTIIFSNAQQAVFIQDVNKKLKEFQADDFVEYNDKLYFSARSDAYGRELYEYDTIKPANTKISLVSTSPTSSQIEGDPKDLFVFNNKLYFSYSLNATGRELYSCNTSNNIQLEADIQTGSADGNPTNFTVYKNNIYFVATNPSGLRELFVYDGVSAPIAITSLSTNTLDAFGNSDFVVNRDTLYFSVNISSSHYALYKYSGTGTPQLSVDSLINQPKELTSFKRQVYLVYNDGIKGEELFKVDTTTNAIQVVADVAAGSGSSSADDLIVYQNTLYFRAEDPNTFEVYLYKTNGSINSFSKVNSGSYLYPRDLFIHNNELYFFALTPVGYQMDFYKTDGVNFSALQVLPSRGYSLGYGRQVLFSFHQNLFINLVRKSPSDYPVLDAVVKYKPNSGFDNFFYDKEFNYIDSITASSTHYTSKGKAIDGKFIYSGKDKHNTSQLYSVSNDTVTQLTNVIHSRSTSSIFDFIGFNGDIYFSYHRIGYSGLFKYDGSTVFTIFNATAPQDLFTYKNELYFSSSITNGAGYELHKLSSNGASTVLIQDFEPGTASSSFMGGYEHNDTLYMNKARGNNRFKWHTYDGTSIKVVPGSNYNISTPTRRFTLTFNHKLYFGAIETSLNGKGVQLWKLENSNTAPTVVYNHIKDLRNMIVHNHKIYFDATNFSSNVSYIYSLDTLNNLDSVATGALINLNSFCSVNGTLYFSANGSNGTELYQLRNGAISIAQDIVPGSVSSSPTLLTNVNDTLFFTASTIPYGYEPYYLEECFADDSVTVSGQTITANLSGATYQWVNCATGQDIVGETSQSFTPSTTGSYACKINDGSCTTISVCNTITVNSTNITEQQLDNILVYPNPTSNKIFVSAPEPIKQITLFNIYGEQVLRTHNKKFLIDYLPSGTYLVHIKTTTKTTVKKIIKN